MTTPEALLEGLADGLRRVIAERSRAEARLADFAFQEMPGSGGDPAPTEVDWRYFVSRTLAAAGEPGTLHMLERLSTGEETVQTLARDHPGGPAGGLAMIDRIGGLAAAGLARRDLETGRVGLTGLGSTVLALTRDWERRLAGAPAADDRGHG